MHSITNQKFIDAFEKAGDQFRIGVCIDPAYGGDGVETAETIDDFVASRGTPADDLQIDGFRFVRWSLGKRDLIVGDAGESRVAVHQ